MTFKYKQEAGGFSSGSHRLIIETHPLSYVKVNNIEVFHISDILLTLIIIF